VRYMAWIIWQQVAYRCKGCTWVGLHYIFLTLTRERGHLFNKHNTDFLEPNRTNYIGIEGVGVCFNSVEIKYLHISPTPYKTAK